MLSAARAHHWPVRAVHARKGPSKSTRRLVAGAWGISLAGADDQAAESQPGSAALSFISNRQPSELENDATR
jgi:hypothetical protein